MVSRAIVYVKSVLISASGPQKWSESHIQALSQGGAPQSSCEKALSWLAVAGQEDVLILNSFGINS